MAFITTAITTTTTRKAYLSSSSSSSSTMTITNIQNNVVIRHGINRSFNSRLLLLMLIFALQVDCISSWELPAFMTDPNLVSQTSFDHSQNYRRELDQQLQLQQRHRNMADNEGTNNKNNKKTSSATTTNSGTSGGGNGGGGSGNSGNSNGSATKSESGSATKIGNGSGNGKKEAAVSDPVPPPPSMPPTYGPTESPAPSPSPSGTPTAGPTVTPLPTANPTLGPTESPAPSPSPSETPTVGPSVAPTTLPSTSPSMSSMPTVRPTTSLYPSDVPSAEPTVAPSGGPTSLPTPDPTSFPSDVPSEEPSFSPSPSALPTNVPSSMPTSGPSVPPTASPEPSMSPTRITAEAANLSVTLDLQSRMSDEAIIGFEVGTVKWVESLNIGTGLLSDVDAAVISQTVVDKTEGEQKRYLQEGDGPDTDKELLVNFSIRSVYTGNDGKFSLHDYINPEIQEKNSLWIRALAASDPTFEVLVPSLTDQELDSPRSAMMVPRRASSWLKLALIGAFGATALALSAAIYSLRTQKSSYYDQELHSNDSREMMMDRHNNHRNSSSPQYPRIVESTTEDEGAATAAAKMMSMMMVVPPSHTNTTTETGHNYGVDGIPSAGTLSPSSMEKGGRGGGGTGDAGMVADDHEDGEGRRMNNDRTRLNTDPIPTVMEQYAFHTQAYTTGRTSQDPPSSASEVNFPLSTAAKGGHEADNGTEIRHNRALFDGARDDHANQRFYAASETGTALTDNIGGTLGAAAVDGNYPASGANGSEYSFSHFQLHARNGGKNRDSGTETTLGARAAAPEEQLQLKEQSSYDSIGRRAGLYDVFAPAGPIGIVVDTTKEGPTVHSLKPTSPMLGLINPGDLIVGLDDEDTRGMTAATLTRLMARKANQKERKITLLAGESFH